MHACICSKIMVLITCHCTGAYHRWLKPTGNSKPSLYNMVKKPLQVRSFDRSQGIQEASEFRY